MTTSIATIVTNATSRDMAIITMVQELGYTLNKAQKAYADYAREAGIAPTVTSHKADALEWLSDRYTSESWDAMAVRESVVELQSEFEVAESTARDYTKAFSEQLGMDHPSENPRDIIFGWFKQRTTAGDVIDKADFMDFAVNELGRSQSNANEYWKGYELHIHLTK